MARIRLRIELNKGRIGVPMDKFSQISVELGQFLIVLGNAVGVPCEKNRWLARDFTGGSSYFTTELAAVADVEHRSRFNRTIKDIAALRCGMLAMSNGVVPQEVLTQYAKMTAPLDIDETIGLGTFETDEEVEPNWLHFTRRNAIELIESIDSSAVYYGAILGSIHLLNKGSTPPYFQIRDIVTADLVKCLYSPEHYSDLVRLLEKREALVYIYGELTVSLADKKIEQVQADRFELAPEFTHEDFQNFFGCAPNLTGKLTTGQYMSKIRNDARSG